MSQQVAPPRQAVCSTQSAQHVLAVEASKLDYLYHVLACALCISHLPRLLGGGRYTSLLRYRLPAPGGLQQARDLSPALCRTADAPVR